MKFGPKWNLETSSSALVLQIYLEHLQFHCRGDVPIWSRKSVGDATVEGFPVVSSISAVQSQKMSKILFQNRVSPLASTCTLSLWVVCFLVGGVDFTNIYRHDMYSYPVFWALRCSKIWDQLQNKKVTLTNGHLWSTRSCRSMPPSGQRWKGPKECWNVRPHDIRFLDVCFKTSPGFILKRSVHKTAIFTKGVSNWRCWRIEHPSPNGAIFLLTRNPQNYLKSVG